MTHTSQNNTNCTLAFTRNTPVGTVTVSDVGADEHGIVEINDSLRGNMII